MRRRQMKIVFCRQCYGLGKGLFVIHSYTAHEKSEKGRSSISHPSFKHIEGSVV